MKSDMNWKSSVFPGALVRSLHVMALAQLVIAWPVYDLLSHYPEFFVARQAQPSDIVFLVVVFSLLLPLLLAGLQALVYRVLPKFGAVLYGVIVFLLFLFLGFLIASRFDSSAYLTIWATMIAVGLLFLYVKTEAGQWFLSFLAPAIVIVPCLFLLDDGIRSLLLPKHTAGTLATASNSATSPLLMVVFDEFPSNVLLGTDGQIDASRFPNFSALSKEAYWYPNATTVATSTVLAIPAILTGRYPDGYRMPHQGEYPDNLFTWLGQDYDLHVHEAVSAMCPASLCSDQRLPPPGKRWQAMMQDVSAIYLNLTAKPLFPDLPAINQSWEGFWGKAIEGGGMYEHRLEQLDGFLEGVQSTNKPGLDFLHVNFPHVPYEYLPSGKRYNDGWLIPGLDLTTNTWVGDARQSSQAYERFVMQVGAVDNWLGQLVAKLKKEDMYERSLIILTADHGVSFEPGSGRRDAPPMLSLDSNILPVPLIIKVPFQSQGYRETRNAETIDILPTVAHVLDRQLPWEVDGASLLGPPRGNDKLAFNEHDKMTPYSSSLEQVEKALSASWIARQRKAPASVLTGMAVTELKSSYDPALQVRLDNAGYFTEVDILDDFLPAHANGEIQWPGHETAELAFVLNGTVAAISTAYADEGKWRFSAILPESGFRAGENTIEIMGVIDGDDSFELVRGLDSNDRLEYNWVAQTSSVSDVEGPLIPDGEGIEGVVDYVSQGSDSLEVFGWGIDTLQGRVLEAVLIFEGNNLIWQGNTHMLRDETHSFGLVIEIGFNAVIPLGILKDRNGSGLRVFAVSDDRRVREIPLKRE